MISAEINQTLLKGGQRIPESDVRRVLRAVASALRLKKHMLISVAFVNERTMRHLNRQYRGRDKVTDVLSFCLTNPSTTPADRPFGELLLCYPQARRQAKEMRHSIRDEVLFLIVHGTLHLFGHDHEKPKDATRMFGIQEKILRRLGIDPRL